MINKSLILLKEEKECLIYLYKIQNKKNNKHKKYIG
jgi:hypothetical protein